MQKVSYMGNGSTTEFYFNFPYFENSNVIVTKNGAATTGYNIVGNSGGLDADIPYTGGKVVFEVAPTSLDSITISRQLPLSRIVDYQPLARIEPTILNQDLNYLLEILKDQKDALDDFNTKYTSITNQETIQNLLTRLDTVGQQIINLGDLSQIRDNISTLNAQTTGLLDYVVESQIPTPQNNYLWYHKFKSGWVEQGGRNTGDYVVGTNTLPVTMADTSYSVIVSRLYPTTADDDASISLQARNLSTTTFQVRQVFVAPGGSGGPGHGAGYAYNWVVSGMSA